MSVAMGMGYTGVHPQSSQRHRDAAATEAERTYALFMHLAGLATFIIAIPIAPTLIMWAIKKDKSPYIDDHGREAINAQISCVLYMLALAALTPLTCGVAAVGLVALPIMAVVFTILAAIAASRGEYHRYPITIRFFQ